jgi:hypothetical protein
MFALRLGILTVMDELFEILEDHVVTMVFWMRGWSKVFAAVREK